MTIFHYMGRLRSQYISNKFSIRFHLIITLRGGVPILEIECETATELAKSKLAFLVRRGK